MITLVIGKPGSGKSYDTTARLADDLVSRLNRGGELPTICTNLKLNEQQFSNYLKHYSKVKTASVKIEMLDEEFLTRPLWWRDLPDDSRIILDEAQFYLSSARISKTDQQDLIEHLSTHRHRRQDWILLTQALTSVSVDVRKYAESVIEVLNAKSLSLPWPLSISLRDVQTLLWGFGVRSQLYRTREGLLEGTYKVTWEGELVVKKTSREIYALYRSTDKKQAGDSALPYADGPGAWRRALRWFFLKHGFRFVLLFVVVGGLLLFGGYLRYHKNPRKNNVVKTLYKSDNGSGAALGLDVASVAPYQGGIITQGARYNGQNVFYDSAYSPRGD